MIIGYLVGLSLCSYKDIVTTMSLMQSPFDFVQGSGPRFTQRQASSGSPVSKTPGNAAWFANDDYGHFIRQEGKEYVMADLTGPGAVVRMWSANPLGTLRMYFDGEIEPRIKVPMRDWVKSLKSDYPDLNDFAFWAGPGWNVYIPFTYKKSLKVTVEPGDKQDVHGLYYHVGYRTFEPGTSVKSFEIGDLSGTFTKPINSGPSLKGEVTLNPGVRSTQYKILGSGQIEDIHLNWNYGAKDLHKTLRSIWVTGTFDGEKTISAPLGDFMAAPFGHGYKDSMEVHLTFNMPFRREAVFTFERNPGSGGDAVLMQFTGSKLMFRDTDALNYFHADFSRDRGKTRPMRDMHWLNVNGPGYLAGVHLLLDNPSRQWWGEGDEKIYVDGETYPSTFGTGTEDFFNYAWGSPAPYWTPCGSQNYTTTAANSFGYCNVSRFMKMDPIPFTKSLKFDMEMWHWADCATTWDRTVYWYGAPGAKVDRQARPSWKELELPDVADIVRIPGAIEAENLKFSANGGSTEIQGGFGDMSGEGQIWWQDAPIGSKLTIEVPHANGEYDLTINACRARDYGIHQLYWNGEKLGGPIDFYDPELKWQQVKLGRVRVTEGKAMLTAECIGANPKADPRRMFGLDYLQMRKL
jgi:hypothetical protein